MIQNMESELERAHNTTLQVLQEEGTVQLFINNTHINPNDNRNIRIRICKNEYDLKMEEIPCDIIKRCFHGISGVSDFYTFILSRISSSPILTITQISDAISFVNCMMDNIKKKHFLILTINNDHIPILDITHLSQNQIPSFGDIIY